MLEKVYDALYYFPGNSKGFGFGHQINLRKLHSVFLVDIMAIMGIIGIMDIMDIMGVIGIMDIIDIIHYQMPIFERTIGHKNFVNQVFSDAISRTQALS